jgi:hypothetical protein
MDDETLRNMRSRAATCRNLARTIGDQRTRKILEDMAGEIEADIRRLEDQEQSTGD